MHILCGIHVHSKRGMKGNEQAQRLQSGDDMKLSKRDSSGHSVGLHTWRRGTSIRETQFWFIMISRWFLIIYPIVSLWKPGVPYPVHGRVLVEIQRPRSLHRKAVIQLNTKRNQHNQSKHQFIWDTNFRQKVVSVLRGRTNPYKPI